MRRGISKFGIHMKQARERSGFSQDELASQLKLSRISIANYERGNQCPSLDAAFAIAAALNFSLDQVNKEVRSENLQSCLDRIENIDLKNSLKAALVEAKRNKATATHG